MDREMIRFPAAVQTVKRAGKVDDKRRNRRFLLGSTLFDILCVFLPSGNFFYSTLALRGTGRFMGRKLPRVV